jgi:acetolactate synthase I/III small subunit
MRRILSVLLENESGALSRVVGLFSQRGYNIESLNVAPTDDHSLSRLTVTTTGDDLKVEQVTKHLNKIIDVVKVVDLTEGAHVERDTLLVKVRAEGEQRDEVKRTTEIFRGQIIDVGPTTYIVQLTGPADKLDSFLQALGETQVLEVVRSGVAGMARGEKILSP